MAMLLTRSKRLTKVNEQLQRGLAAAETIFALLDEPPEPDRGIRAIGRARGEVRFHAVSHRYRDDGGEVLHQLELDVRPAKPSPWSAPPAAVKPP